MGNFSFPKCKRLLNRTEFVNLNRSGKRLHTKHFTIIFKQNGLSVTRLGLTVSRKVGKAVRRNRVKRLIREFFRLNRSYIPQGYDIVIIAKKDADHLTFRETETELAEIILHNKKFCI